MSRCRMRRAAAAGEAVAIDRTKATRCQKRTCVATRGLNKLLEPVAIEPVGSRLTSTNALSLPGKM